MTEEEAKKKRVRGWVAVTPKGRILDLGGGIYWVKNRRFGWCDDTKWRRATITIWLDPPKKARKP